MVDCRLKRNKKKSSCKNLKRRNNSNKRKSKRSKRKSNKRSKKKSSKKYRTSKNCKYTHVTIKKSTRSGKKKMAVFENKNTSRKKTIHFGQAGASDFTKHKDKERRSRYLSRHKKRENWNKCDTAGALSRWVLWNKPSMNGSISSFKKKFSLK